MLCHSLEMKISVMISSNRSKFLEMCEGLLARVEPHLRSVLEQASKYTNILLATVSNGAHKGENIHGDRSL